MDWMIVHLPIAGVEIMAWKLVLIGLTVGVIGGFFGVGGAFMVTPALNVFGFPMAYAIGTDMAHMAGKSVVATIKHRKLGNVDMKLGLMMVIFTAAGIELGARLIVWLEAIGRCGPVVRIVYMALLFGLGSYMIYEYVKLRRRIRNGETVDDAATSRLAKRLQSICLPPMADLRVSGVRISIWIVGAVAFATGFIAGFLGVGGGFIRMPSLIYIIGCPTTVAVGTDLFEVMVSGAYGAFTYALKGKVEIVAAILMLAGAAVGAQFGTLATKYVKGIVIRLYFAITMLLAGVSVVFKHVASVFRYQYEDAARPFIEAQMGKGTLSLPQLRDWMLLHKTEFSEWLAGQSAAIQHALRMETVWNNLAGWLMLGSACALSLVIVLKMVRGILYERRLRARTVAADRV
ncbi:MAG: sulfite exporter TauE/SafE family protein [Candidatus Sumerlaeota bacterium]|nr:sulfite exporter TauE/SafE family protein [Candidatus Sumerlaeota bacterium]